MLATLVPSLLMLGAFGMERVEKLVGKPDDGGLRELLERAAARPAPDAAPAPGPGYPMMSILDAEPGLPTRVFRPAAVNPQFQPTRRVNDV